MIAEADWHNDGLINYEGNIKGHIINMVKYYNLSPIEYNAVILSP